MTAKPLVPRALAIRDVEAAVDYYAREAGEAVALDLVAELERLFRSIAETPGIGSSRYAHELDLPGLRARPLRGFPYRAFYVERADHVDLWRVLHTAQDIAEWMSDPGLGD